MAKEPTGRVSKLTPFQKEMIVSGHRGLTNKAVAAIYNITPMYAGMLRRGVRGVKGTRSEGVQLGWGIDFRKMRTASEMKFRMDCLAIMVPLLRKITRAEMEMKAAGVFETKIEPEKRERKWRHARLPTAVEAQGKPEGNAGPLGGPVPGAGAGGGQLAVKRPDGPGDEGFLFDSRRRGG